MKKRGRQKVNSTNDNRGAWLLVVSMQSASRGVSAPMAGLALNLKQENFSSWLKIISRNIELTSHPRSATRFTESVALPLWQPVLEFSVRFCYLDLWHLDLQTPTPELFQSSLIVIFLSSTFPDLILHQYRLSSNLLFYPWNIPHYLLPLS
jgi:hypothetical protein